ncbi:hypothetical protein GCM10027161_33670 [Microbispora hainanensis]
MTDGPFAETTDLIADRMIIDVESWDRAVQLAGHVAGRPAGRPQGRLIGLAQVPRRRAGTSRQHREVRVELLRERAWTV